MTIAVTLSQILIWNFKSDLIVSLRQKKIYDIPWKYFFPSVHCRPCKRQIVSRYSLKQKNIKQLNDNAVNRKNKLAWTMSNKIDGIKNWRTLVDFLGDRGLIFFSHFSLHDFCPRLWVLIQCLNMSSLTMHI